MAKPKFDPSKPFEVVDVKAEKPKFDPSKPFLSVDEKSQVPGDESALEAARVGLEKAITFGARPFVKGVGGGIGEAAARLVSPREMDFLERLKRTKEGFGVGFSEEKELAQKEQKELSEKHPMISAGSELAGGLLTAPLTPVRGVGSAIKLGLMTGAGRSLGEAKDLGEAAKMTAGGGLLGAAGYGASKLAGKAIQKGSELSKTGLKRLASNLSGLTEKEIETYASRPEEVKKIMSTFGEGEAADTIRTEFMNNIRGARQKYGSAIGEALKKPDFIEPKHDLSPVVKKLEEKLSSISKIKEKLGADDINDLRELTKKIRELGTDGKVSVSELHEIKEFLQDFAKPSYLKNGQIFTRGDLSQGAAKNAAREAKVMVDRLAPEIAEANQKLFQMHAIEDNINKNLITPGKAAGGLISAGKGENKQSIRMLKQLSGLTGQDMLKRAEELAAAETFKNAKLLPQDVTGKSLTRALAGTAAGGLIGGPVGAMAGAAATSPIAIKAAIDAGQIPMALINKMGGAEALKKLVDNPNTSAAIIKYLTTNMER